MEDFYLLAMRQFHQWLNYPFENENLINNFLEYNKNNERYFLIQIQNKNALIIEKPKQILNDALLERAQKYRDLIETVLKKFDVDMNFYLLYDAHDFSDEDDKIPIFSFQRKIGSNKILLPDIDFLVNNFYLKQKYADGLQFSEKLCSAVFVGSTTGGRITKNVIENLSLPRLRAAVYFKDKENIKFLLPNILQYDNEETKTMLESMGFGKRNYVEMKEQYKNKFIISMDGNGATCSRLALGLKSNCIVLKYNSLYELYYFTILNPWIHYIPIEKDEDILNIIEFEKNNAGVFEKISSNSKVFFDNYLNASGIFNYLYFLLSIYERVFFKKTKKINFEELCAGKGRTVEDFAEWGDTPVDEGKELFGNGEFAKAEQAFRAAIAHDDRDPEVHWWLSATLDRLGQKAAAAKAAEEATRRAPDAARYWEHLGHMRAAAGEIEAAESAFSRACQIEPGRASALGALSHTLGALQRWEEAIAAARAALLLLPEDTNLFFHLGNLLFQAGSPIEAAAAYRQAIALGRAGEDVERQLAEALRRAEEIAAMPAEESAEASVPATPEPISPTPVAVAPITPEPTTPPAPAPNAPRHGFWHRIFAPRQVFGP